MKDYNRMLAEATPPRRRPVLLTIRDAKKMSITELKDLSRAMRYRMWIALGQGGDDETEMKFIEATEWGQAADLYKVMRR